MKEQSSQRPLWEQYTKEGQEGGNPPPGTRQRGGVATTRNPSMGEVCSRCGKSPLHDRQRCPARDATCHKYGKRGHYQRLCKSAKVGAVHQDKLNPGKTDDPFLGVVGEVEKPWVVKVLLNETPMEFHIDTRAEVTVISDLNSTSSATQPCCPPYVSSRDQAKKPYQ